MISDDSLTEADDSFFDIYSTQKVTNTYNTLLEKIKTASSENEEVIHEQTEAVKNEDGISVPSPKSSSAEDSSEIIIIDDPPDCDLVNESTPGVRRSTRISKRRNVNSVSAASESTGVVARGRKKKSKSNSKNISESVVDISDDNEDLSDDEMNYEVSVKIIWKSVSVETFRLKRFQTFTKIFKHFMDAENVAIENIYLSLKNTKISPQDTPESLDLKVYDFIEGGIVSDSSKITTKPSTNELCPSKDSVTIKIQDVAKNVLKFSVNKNEELKYVMMRYAMQIEVPLNKIKFFFDGEVLKPSQTLVMLGIDDNEVIDVKITQ